MRKPASGDFDQSKMTFKIFLDMTNQNSLMTTVTIGKDGSVDGILPQYLSNPFPPGNPVRKPNFKKFYQGQKLIQKLIEYAEKQFADVDAIPRPPELNENQAFVMSTHMQRDMERLITIASTGAPTGTPVDEWIREDLMCIIHVILLARIQIQPYSGRSKFNDWSRKYQEFQEFLTKQFYDCLFELKVFENLGDQYIPNFYLDFIAALLGMSSDLLRWLYDPYSPNK
jgi:hypothetical protein